MRTQHEHLIGVLLEWETACKQCCAEAITVDADGCTDRFSNVVTRARRYIREENFPTLHLIHDNNLKCSRCKRAGAYAISEDGAELTRYILTRAPGVHTYMANLYHAADAAINVLDLRSKDGKAAKAVRRHVWNVMEELAELSDD